VIYDGNKKEEAESFAKSYPDFHCELLPTDDIRDKDEGTKKVGMFDKNKNIKAGYRNACVQILSRIDNYLKPYDGI